MGRKRLITASEFMATSDRFEEVPDEILATIISLLPLREAVRTSVVSKRWRFVWTSHSALKLDFANVLGSRVRRLRNTCRLSSIRRIQRRKFVTLVDKIMHQRLMGDKINSLAIYFHLGKEWSSHFDNWINCAVSKGVENIDLDLSECTSFRNSVVMNSNSFEQYEFQSSLLGEKCNLKQLRLDSCILRSPLSPNSLSSLISVELRRVCINDALLMDLLSSCLLLKKLILHFCPDLVNLKFTNPSHQLKFLDVKDCFGLNVIETSSENLTRLEYRGHPINFTFKQVHKLAEVYLCLTDKNQIDAVTYALTKLASELPHLEKLNLNSILFMMGQEVPENGPVFKNVRQLVLTIYPFDDEDKLGWIAYILRAFPLLQKLQLNLCSSCFIEQPKEIERFLPEFHHKHLAELEINGFYGNSHEVKLLMYLLENATSLGRLVVGTKWKVFNGFDSWAYEEANSFCRSRMKTNVTSLLHEVVPRTIRLEFQ